MTKPMYMFPRNGPEKFTYLDYIRDGLSIPFAKIDTRDLLEHTIAGAIDCVLDQRAEYTKPEQLSFHVEHSIVTALMNLSNHDVIDFSKIASYVDQFHRHDSGEE